MLISGVSQCVVNCTTMNPFIRDVVLYDWIVPVGPGPVLECGTNLKESKLKDMSGLMQHFTAFLSTMEVTVPHTARFPGYLLA